MPLSRRVPPQPIRAASEERGEKRIVVAQLGKARARRAERLGSPLRNYPRIPVDTGFAAFNRPPLHTRVKAFHRTFCPAVMR